MNTVKILYIGSLKSPSNSYHRFLCLKEMGYLVEGIDTDYYIHQSIFEKINFRTLLGPGVIKLNKIIKVKITQENWDIIWVDNRPYISSKTLKIIKSLQPQCKIVNLVTDDAFGRYKSLWKTAHKTAKFYDWHFVQRPENIEEYKKCGANNVDFCFRSFNPEFHRPILLSEEEKKIYFTSVGFIGSYEEEREDVVSFLIKNGINVSVTGDGWAGKKYWNIIKPLYRGESVYGDEYIKRINGMDICLHFLRKGNRDSQDSRTFEIPACKTFMLAERSELHEQFFVENKEAVFFDSAEELLQKIKYYIANPSQRSAIAEAGYKKCFEAGYKHQDRLMAVIEKVKNLNNK